MLLNEDNIALVNFQLEVYVDSHIKHVIDIGSLLKIHHFFII